MASKKVKKATKVAKKPVKSTTAKKAKPVKKAKPQPKKKEKPKAKAKISPKKVVAKAKPKKAVVAKKKATKPAAKAKKVVAKSKVSTPKKTVKPVKKAVKPIAKKAKIQATPVKKATPTPVKKEIAKTEKKEVIVNKAKVNGNVAPVTISTSTSKDKTRYSDAELKEFKQIILSKLEEAHRDNELLKASMTHKDDHGTDDTSPTFKLMEDGTDVMTREETAQLAARQQKFIKHLEDALVRIENKTYGICRVTGKLISKERLRVVPHATLSIDAKRMQ
jgi:RNA polymerase-binding transcription factor DksA